MKPNQQIRNQREQLRLTEADVAAKAGLTRSAYRDIEWYEDEAYTATPLRALRAIGEILELDLLSLFGIHCALCSGDRSVTEMFRVPRNTLIAERRAALGLTREQLGDDLGFETIAVEELEQDPDYVDRWPIELIQQLATQLRLPMTPLLRIPCEKCRHDGNG
jgi:transcriptional regulator with XRE-family HTH domain